MTERENCLIAFHHGIPEWIPIARDAINHLGFWAGNECGIRGESVASGIHLDIYGCKWDLCHGMPTPLEGDHLLTLDEIENWEEIICFPNPETWDWDTLAKEELAQYDPSKVMVYFCEQGCFDRLTTLMGFEEACMAMMEEPEICSEIFRKIADVKIKLIRCVKKHLKPDVFMYTDDIADARGLVMHPEVYRALLKPQQARIIAAIKENGMIAEQHTCGNCSAVLEDYVEIGVDAFFPAQACNNIPEIKRRFGNQLVICGGFDSQGPCGHADASRDIMLAEAKRVVEDCAKGGAFIFAPALLDQNSMMDEAMESPAGKALYEGFLEYGKNFYEKEENRSFPK